MVGIGKSGALSFILRICIHKKYLTKDMTRQAYETDLTDNEWVSLNPISQNTTPINGLNKNLLKKRVKAGKAISSTYAIIDSQSVKPRNATE